MVPSDMDEIPAVLASQVQAWNAGDLDAFCAFYSDDALFLSPSSVVRGSLRERYRRDYPDRAAMGRLALEILELRVRGDAGSVALAWTLDEGRLTGRALLVFHRLADGWRIVQDATWATAPPG